MIDQQKTLFQSPSLPEPRNAALVTSLIIALCSVVAVFTAWAAITPVNEVARAPGEVVPVSSIKVVQHADGGIIDDIFVKEGDSVRKGQVLMVLNGEGVREDLERLRGNQAALSAQEERLRAYMEGRQPDFAAIDGLDAMQERDQSRFYDVMKKSREDDTVIVREQLAQKRGALQSLYAEMAAEADKLKIERSLHQKRQALYQKGFYSEARYLQSQQSLSSQQGAVTQLQSRIGEVKAEIAEFETRLKSLASKDGDAMSERLDAVVAEKRQNAETIKKLQAKVDRLEIRAPADGTVKGILYQTPGAILRPAETLMEIVPAAERMIVEVKVLPQYVSRLRVGQPVNVKVSSYDFSRDGYAPGKLSQVSAATFTTDGGERYYQARVTLDRDYVGDNAHNVVLPGMTAMAEIVTGQKTILQYLLKPVHNSLKTAFTER